MNTAKLKVIDYYDNIRNTIDIRTEEYLAENPDKYHFINEKRSQAIEKINQIEKLNLKKEIYYFSFRKF